MSRGPADVRSRSPAGNELNSDPEVSVVILTWNDGPLLDVALTSVRLSRDVSAEIIVVDNGSQPPAQVADDVVLIRHERNLGVAAGRNVGVRRARAELVCLLDSDAALHSETLAVLASALEAEPRAALAAPVFSGQPPTASAGRAPTLWRKLRRATGLTDEYDPVAIPASEWWDVDFAIGACQLFRRLAYDQIGGVDERWFYGPEDADFCMRLKSAGWRVLQVDVLCDHPPRRRNRRVFTRRGFAHAIAVLQFHFRHRRFSGRMRTRSK